MKKRVPLIVIVVMAMSVITIDGIYAYGRVNQPTSTNLNAGTSKPATTTFQINLSPKLQNNKYASFDYPVGMSARTSQPSGPVVASFVYTTSDVQTWELAIGVTMLNEPNLMASDSYTLRLDNPSQYAESSAIINSKHVNIMADKTTGGFSEVGYFLHGNLLATVSLIGDDSSGTGPLQNTFNMVISSWQWK